MSQPASEDQFDDLTQSVETKCPFCRETRTIEVNANALYDFRNGKSASEAFPEMSSDDREALITGICANCWPKDPDEEEDEEEDDEEESIPEGSSGEGGDSDAQES